MLSASRLTILFLAFLAKTALSAALPLEKIKLPPGFKIEIFAEGLPNARSLELTPNGTLFVGTMQQNGPVYAVVDTNGDFRADRKYTIASGLYMPNGVAFRGGSLYVAEVDRILRYDDIVLHLASPPRPVVVFDKLPSDQHHGWKFIRFGPDGKLYIPVGAPCNICESDLPYAALHRINPDGTGFETVARGIRNTVGFDWDPRTGELWFTDNGRDYLGDNLPPDELNHVTALGQHFGYPYWHAAGIKDPQFGDKRPVGEFTLAAMPLGPHVAALGMRFYTGRMFPEMYRNQIFIAEHGSWNRSVPIGYRITLVTLKDNKAADYKVFAEGWLGSDGSVWGRPVDLEEMPDGSLLVSDDYAGAVYRISYSEPVKPALNVPVELSPGESVEFAAADPALQAPGNFFAWSLDGSPAAGASKSSFSLSGDSLKLGSHLVSLEVTAADGNAVGSYQWQVQLIGPQGLSCDYSADGRLDVIDVISLLILAHSFPGAPLTDYNRDGRFSVDDALSLIHDLRSGNCLEEVAGASVPG